MFALMLFVLAQTVTPPPAKSPGNLGEELFYAARSASGSKLCDRRQGERYRRLYDKRYGRRVSALVRYHESRFGPDANFIYTTDCLRLGGSSDEQDLQHDRAMRRFEFALRDLERRYGPPKADK